MTPNMLAAVMVGAIVWTFVAYVRHPGRVDWKSLVFDVLLAFVLLAIAATLGTAVSYLATR